MEISYFKRSKCTLCCWSQRMGPDADDEQAEGMVGKDEVVCDTLYDYETLFDGIDLRKYPVHMITASPFSLANYIVIAQKQGIPLEKLRGSMSNMLRPEKECIDIMEYCTANLPLFNSGYLDMRNIREGGCTAAQEIAFGVALAISTAEILMKQGLDIDDFTHRITWFVNSGPEFFEEAAKFRAMRRLWARTFKKRLNAKKPASLLCRMHCQTYAPTLTKAQPFFPVHGYKIPCFPFLIVCIMINTFFILIKTACIICCNIFHIYFIIINRDQ
ncbi:MAG TPA: hypothetical protein DD405_03045 [Desulfobacteraceae bacterium]|nr:hypothetical protein [Desulfobacteraceae bacterium]